jgi:hypothetical protein
VDPGWGVGVRVDENVKEVGDEYQKSELKIIP